MIADCKVSVELLDQIIIKFGNTVLIRKHSILEYFYLIRTFLDVTYLNNTTYTYIQNKLVTIPIETHDN